MKLKSGLATNYKHKNLGKVIEFYEVKKDGCLIRDEILVYEMNGSKSDLKPFAIAGFFFQSFKF
ncbi:hypothetical protein Hanom_Chr17g01573721 [Helianthus anomalus]